MLRLVPRWTLHHELKQAPLAVLEDALVVVRDALQRLRSSGRALSWASCNRLYNEEEEEEEEKTSRRAGRPSWCVEGDRPPPLLCLTGSASLLKSVYILPLRAHEKQRCYHRQPYKSARLSPLGRA